MNDFEQAWMDAGEGDELAERPTERLSASSFRRHTLHEVSGAAAGALAGAAIGAIGGPVGLATGVLLGGVIGAFVTKVSDEESERISFHDGELDAIIGVTGGEIGAPNLEHPPATRGTYSAASAGGAGISSGGRAEADGPMSAPDD